MLDSPLKLWKSLSLVQRAGLIAVTAAVLCGILFVAGMASRPTYGVLFSNLEADDAGAVTAKLRDMKVDYQISAGGSAIEVPEDKVYDLRLSMASEGLPRGGTVGFELFDKMSFGATDFTQHLDYQRALQGELTRTIDRLDGVVDSRVHLVIPEKRLFTENDDPATASVVLHLRPGYQVTEQQVGGIVHLVASGVEGLKPENVSVLDQEGNTLSGGGSSSPMVTDSQAQLQERYENRLAAGLQRLADQVLGPGKTAIRVTADLNWDQNETTKETFRPAGAQGRNLPTEETSSTETYARNSLPSGVPDPTGLQAQPNPAAKPGQYLNSQAGRHYAVDKVTEKQVTAPGKVRKLSVAVFMDQNVGPDQQKALQEAFAVSAGLDTTPVSAGGRGDQIQLLPYKFDHTADKVAAKAAAAGAKQNYTLGLARNGAAVLIVLLMAGASFILSRRARTAAPEPFDATVGDETPAPDSLDPEERMLQSLDRRSEARPAAPIDRVRQLTDEHPDEVARQLQTWLARQ